MWRDENIMEKNMLPVIADKRTVKLNKNMTVNEAKEYVNNLGMKLSLIKTYKYYGIIYTDEIGSSKKYKLLLVNNGKSKISDLTLSQLNDHRNRLIKMCANQ